MSRLPTHKEDSGPKIFSIVTLLLSRPIKGYGATCHQFFLIIIENF